MGIQAIRHPRRARGTSTTGSLVMLATVSVVGIASFGQFGEALEENVQGKTPASALSLASDNPLHEEQAGEQAQNISTTPYVQIGGSSSAAIDPSLADTLIDYVAGKGPRPSQIPAGSDADKLLDEVITAVKTLVGDDTATKNAVIAALKNNHGDLEKILFEGINDINDISEEVRTAILEGIGKRIASGESVGLLGEILESLETLGRNLEKNHAAGRAELQTVLNGGSITSDEPADDEPADTSTPEEPAADEPAADEPAADEPAADEPAADEPSADHASVDDSSQAAGGTTNPEATGKAILDAINASPEASAAAATLLEDPEVIELVSDAASGKLNLDAESVIELLRDKPGIVAVLQALIKDPKVMALLKDQVDPQFLPLLNVFAANPGLLQKLANYVQNASDSDVALITDLIEQIQEGNFDAADVSKYLPLLKDPAVLSILRDLGKDPAVAQLLEQYIGPAAGILTSNPELIDHVTDFLGSASEEDIALITNAIENGFSDEDIGALLQDPDTYALLEELWQTDARDAIIDMMPGPIGFLAGLLGDNALPVARWWFSDNFFRRTGRFFSDIGSEAKSLWNLGLDGWLTEKTGNECDGWFNTCRLKQAGSVFSKGVGRIGSWLGFGGGDDEPAKAIGTPASKPVTTTSTASTSDTTSTSMPDAASTSTAVATNLPPVLGYSPAYPGLLQRQMMRIAAEQSLNS